MGRIGEERRGEVSRAGHASSVFGGTAVVINRVAISFANEVGDARGVRSESLLVHGLSSHS
jgi:hypothetical protein